MTPTPDLMLTVLSCATLASVCALAIAVLPWTDDEVNASWGAWGVLFGALRTGVRRLRAPSTSPARIRAVS